MSQTELREMASKCVCVSARACMSVCACVRQHCIHLRQAERERAAAAAAGARRHFKSGLGGVRSDPTASKKRLSFRFVSNSDFIIMGVRFNLLIENL